MPSYRARVVASKPRDSPLSLRVLSRRTADRRVARSSSYSSRSCTVRVDAVGHARKFDAIHTTSWTVRYAAPHNIRSGTSCSDRVSPELAVSRVRGRVAPAASGLRAPSLRRAPGEARKLPAGSRLGTNTIGGRPSALLSHRARPGDSHPRAIAQTLQIPRRFGEPGLGRVESTTI